MAQHMKILGILFIVWGVLSILFGFFVVSLIAYAGFIIGHPRVLTLVTVVAATISSFSFLTGILEIVGGWGLLKRQRWSRVLVIIMAAVNLIDLPFGTALGIYGLWVLFNPESEKYLAGEKTEQVVTT